VLGAYSRTSQVMPIDPANEKAPHTPVAYGGPS
jgi:hypothetical protein